MAAAAQASICGCNELLDHRIPLEQRHLPSSRPSISATHMVGLPEHHLTVTGTAMSIPDSMSVGDQCLHVKFAAGSVSNIRIQARVGDALTPISTADEHPDHRSVLIKDAAGVRMSAKKRNGFVVLEDARSRANASSSGSRIFKYTNAIPFFGSTYPRANARFARGPKGAWLRRESGAAAAGGRREEREEQGQQSHSGQRHASRLRTRRPPTRREKL